MAKEEKQSDDWMEEYEGQLAIDVYQTPEEMIIKAPIAGVAPEDLEISITDEVVTVRGQRRDGQDISRENYFCQECYWGAFSRSYVLPIAVDSENARANLKDGILTIAIPKQEKTKTHLLKVETV